VTNAGTRARAKNDEERKRNKETKTIKRVSRTIHHLYLSTWAVLLGLVASQCPGQDSLDGGKLHVSDLGNGQAVKGRAHDVAKLGPKVTPVRVGVTSALLDIVAVLKRPRHGVTQRLVTDEGNVPLLKMLAKCSEVKRGGGGKPQQRQEASRA
jgi:hypothetical protein